MPASTSPSETLVRTALTSASWLTGVTVILALANTFVAMPPQGTCAWQTATFTPGFARSFTEAMLAGLAAGTAISPTFLANGVEEAAPPALMTASMFVWLADAKTSAGWPCVMPVARAEDAPKFGVMVTPGCAASNCFFRVVNVSCSDAAAKTFTVPVIAAVVDRLAAHEGDDTVRAGLDLDLRHDGVANHPGDQPDEPVPCGLRPDQPERRLVTGGGEGLGERGQLGSRDDVPAPCIRCRGQPTSVDPPSNGVVAHPEEVGSFSNPERRHRRSIVAGAASSSTVSRFCGELVTSPHDSREDVRPGSVHPVGRDDPTPHRVDG